MPTTPSSDYGPSLIEELLRFEARDRAATIALMDYFRHMSHMGPSPSTPPPTVLVEGEDE
ncbi:MAG: hypothetical protein A2Y78_11260 [Acidobacteria bacterium RBG_13_68_16]|nr:MAG: hypothetical protein A2Y78_11260 [Acidobacteria bacterium RBG_13_68_16]